VLDATRKKFSSPDQCVIIGANNRVGVRDTDGDDLVAESSSDGTVDVPLSVQAIRVRFATI
jgi:hypothetical protein